ncbi:hypothetical protein TSUD_24420 [Trifolium subterraneum]|uniref:Zinc finger PMZ-type domain-containing protein n=1 Tax=Trifolium subterraneum TaxID=3900 RepID=A0A2Z6NN08_TRISU|nr:hypothetical protein TSUD_24420 [Trifolium subterraneum]
MCVESIFDPEPTTNLELEPTSNLDFEPTSNLDEEPTTNLDQPTLNLTNRPTQPSVTIPNYRGVVGLVGRRNSEFVALESQSQNRYMELIVGYMDRGVRFVGFLGYMMVGRDSCKVNGDTDNDKVRDSSEKVSGDCGGVANGYVSYPQPSQPSSSTYAPTHNERPNEVPNYAEEVSDHSGDEEENIELLFQSDDANDDADENVRQDDAAHNVREAYNPPSFMRNLDDTVDDPTRVLLYETQRLPVDAGISVGMIFHTKADCLQAVKNYHINKSVQYKIEKSDKTRYVIKCEQPQCQFSMRASKSEMTQLWSIVNIKNSHTCTSSSLSQDHPRLDASLISQCIVPILKDNLSTPAKVIIVFIRNKFNHTIRYRKAWNAKNKAIEKICGNWVDSFHDLPQWLMVMEQWNPGTIVRLETSPTGIQGQMFFDHVFWAFKPRIEGFVHCKPLVQVDGTWLNGKYKGTLLLAIAQDGNNHIFPVTFAIVEGETKEAWNFFLKNLREHVTPQEGICIQIGTRLLKVLMIILLMDGIILPRRRMWYAPSVSSFQYWQKKLAEESIPGLNWVSKIDKAKRTQVFDGGRRWGHMTRNLAESMNSVYNEIRSQPITSLVTSTFYKGVDLFFRRSRDAAAVYASHQEYTEACQERIQEAFDKANTHVITWFNRQDLTFSVQETEDPREGRPMDNFKVNLRAKCCDCGKFQSLHMPYTHVIAACSYARIDYHQFIDDVYKVATVCAVYAGKFQVIQGTSFWPDYEGDRLCARTDRKRVKKGRPQKNRMRTEMDDFHPPVRRCGLCRVLGHNATECPNAAGTSS